MSRLVGADDNGWATLTINQSLAGGNGRMSHSWSSDSSPEQSDKVRSGSPVVGRNGGRRQVWHFSSGSAELEATASNSGPHIPGNCVDPFHLPKFSSLNSTSHRRSVDFLRQPSRSFVEVERGGALRPSRRSLDVVEPARSYRCAREQKVGSNPAEDMQCAMLLFILD